MNTLLAANSVGFSDRFAGGTTGPAATHPVEKAATKTIEHTNVAGRAAGAYYHFTGERFTASRTYSRVLVPGAAAAIRIGAK